MFSDAKPLTFAHFPSFIVSFKDKILHLIYFEGWKVRILL